MESIEPFDYSQTVPFQLAYLTGYYADKYDIPPENGQSRIRQRVEQSLRDQVQTTVLEYSSVLPTSCQIHVQNSSAKYVLLPVWILNTNYNGKLYTFAMNGQTGKMTGSFPVSQKRSILWFSGICAGVTALVHLLQMFL